MFAHSSLLPHVHIKTRSQTNENKPMMILYEHTKEGYGNSKKKKKKRGKAEDKRFRIHIMPNQPVSLQEQEKKGRSEKGNVGYVFDPDTRGAAVMDGLKENLEASGCVICSRSRRNDEE